MEVYKHSTEKEVEQFIGGASDLEKELSLLAHEYGHYSLNNIGPIQRSSLEDCQREFQIEFDTWSKGKKTLESLGVTDWAVFNEERRKSLDDYYDGFRSLFPNFSPLTPYSR